MANERVAEDRKKVQESIKKEKRSNTKLKSRQEDNSEMPQILDYVAQKAEMYELIQDVKNYKRKVEIAEAAAKMKKRELKLSQQITAGR